MAQQPARGRRKICILVHRCPPVVHGLADSCVRKCVAVDICHAAADDAEADRRVSCLPWRYRHLQVGQAVNSNASKAGIECRTRLPTAIATVLMMANVES